LSGAYGIRKALELSLVVFPSISFLLLASRHEVGAVSAIHSIQQFQVWGDIMDILACFCQAIGGKQGIILFECRPL
jgi:hypothetical protein